jgi:hypothetical protein
MRLQHSVVSEKYFTALRDQTEDKSPWVFEGGEFESGVHSPEILLVDWKPIGIEPLRNQLMKISFSRKQFDRDF